MLNIPPSLQTPSHAFAELRDQFGEVSPLGDPLADFYERFRLPNESSTIYAVELEATLRTVEERINKGRPLPTRNRMLTQQFMRGVRDDKVTQRLAPMKPRDMTFRDLQTELRQLERESKMSAAFKLAQSQQTRPQNSPSQSQQAKVKPPVNQPDKSQPASDNSEVLQNLLLTVRQLAEKVEQMSTKPTRALS